MEAQGKWTPLVDGELQIRALIVAEEIVLDIANRSELVCDGSLASGHAGLATAFAYFDRVFPGRGYDNTAEVHLNSAMEYLAEAQLSPDLYGGFTGIAWAAAQVDRLASRRCNAGDEFSQVDDLLLDMLSAETWNYHYDLISGLVGLAVYALERLPHPQAHACLTRIVEHLVHMAEHRPNGITWLTPLDLLHENRREARPNGEYNVGLAHGVPGVIAVLAQAIYAGVLVDVAMPLLDQAVAWLLAQRITNSPGANFGYVANSPDCLLPSRSAWCYGDPGVAASLFCAARSCSNTDWEGTAIELAIACGNRPEHEMGVNDAGICHGWAGLAHIFNRLYQSTGQPQLRDPAIRFVQRTLDARRLGRGIAGYSVWAGESLEDKVGFLEGASGIAMALAAAASAVEPSWDSVLLISNTVVQ